MYSTSLFSINYGGYSSSSLFSSFRNLFQNPYSFNSDYPLPKPLKSCIFSIYFLIDVFFKASYFCLLYSYNLRSSSSFFRFSTIPLNYFLRCYGPPTLEAAIWERLFIIFFLRVIDYYIEAIDFLFLY